MSDAETTLLGTLIAENGAPFRDIDLNPGDFTQPWMEHLYQHLFDMWGQGQRIDLLTVSSSLPADPLLTAAKVAEIFTGASVTAAAPHHAGIIAADAARRRLDNAARAIAGLAQEPDIENAVEKARALVDAALPATSRTETDPMATIVDDVLNDLANPPKFHPTPWKYLNDVINGWRPGAMYVIGARPAMGKTVVGLNAAMGLTQYGHVLYISMEMPRTQLVQRAMSTVTGISQDRLDRRELSAQDWDALRRARTQLDRTLWIYDGPISNPAAIRSAARSIARKGPIAGIVIDYIQLMTNTAAKDKPRHEVVSEFSRAMKLAAHEFGCPVLALSQLNRQSEQRENRLPSIADLRESGSLEQDADVVMLLHRDLKDHPETLNIGVAKNRHGRTGAAELVFAGYRYQVRDN